MNIKEIFVYCGVGLPSEDNYTLGSVSIYTFERAFAGDAYCQEFIKDGLYDLFKAAVKSKKDSE